jgi:hypothetical protein
MSVISYQLSVTAFFIEIIDFKKRQRIGAMNGFLTAYQGFYEHLSQPERAFFYLWWEMGRIFSFWKRIMRSDG